ncbi:MAG: nitroreductase family protein [Myxococcota bacterium]|nr:nitroreductase family protein [Myxococcota bacterium]
MPDALHVLRTTRSVRRRLDFERPVERAVLEECIEAAVQAPTGLEREAWRFLVLTDPEPKHAIAQLYRRSFESLTQQWSEAPPVDWGDATPPHERTTYRGLAERMHEMPALVLVCSLGRPDADDAAMQLGFWASVLPAAWSLMLALRAKGLGTTWTTLLARERVAVAEALGIPQDVTQTVLLPVAYTKDAKLAPAQRKSASEVTYWNGWGRAR